MSNFKKGEWEKAEDVVMHDLKCLSPKMNKKDFEYHYNLLEKNLEDLFGITKRLQVRGEVETELVLGAIDWDDISIFMDEHFQNEKSVAWNIKHFKKWYKECVLK